MFQTSDRRNSSENPCAILPTGNPLVFVVMIVPGFRMASTFFSKSPLDLEILNHSFENPIHLGQFLQIVFKIADRDQAR